MASSSRPDSDSTEPTTQLHEGLATVKVRYVPLPTPLPVNSHGAIRHVVSASMRAPCRRCLEDANPGDKLDLISYDPFPADSVTPYRGFGPIFVHADGCELFIGDTIPFRQLDRMMSVRAFDENHMMVAAEVVHGSKLENVSGGMLADEKARYINVYNAKPGCFAFTIERA